ncbi:hypothetical protein ACFWA4_32325 [Streptomyces sp. NPDC060011]|jgi:hypothetical protein|nr:MULTISPECIES: hypothetical protein [unclassified Streptomyces]MCX5138259.1 hypothetical protein [Streptomyces sp. NBC_00340]WSD74835.1 hypothetical protein OHB33_00090 [Streptomyces sp. NBC_01558]
MVVIALLLPILLVLMLFGLDALENVLFPSRAEHTPPGMGEPSEPL